MQVGTVMLAFIKSAHTASMEATASMREVAGINIFRFALMRLVGRAGGVARSGRLVTARAAHANSHE